MKKVSVKELKDLELVKIMVKEFLEDEISIEALKFLRDVALTANNYELFYTNKKAIDELTMYIDEKIKEVDKK